MKIPIILINREHVMLYLAFCEAFKHLRKGFKGLFSCIVLSILCIPFVIWDLLLRVFKKEQII